MTKERRYEVSDGVTGEWTITGYFAKPLDAVRAFIRCHDIDHDSLLVYELLENDEDSCCYSVNVEGEKITIQPIPRG